jgi:hypothetical protein
MAGHRYRRPNQVAWVIAVGEALLTNIAKSPSIHAALAEVGYTAEALEFIAKMVAEVRTLEVSQEAAKGATRQAIDRAHEAVVRFRRWFLPWRRQIKAALRGRPDLAMKLGQAA